MFQNELTKIMNKNIQKCSLKISSFAKPQNVPIGKDVRPTNVQLHSNWCGLIQQMSFCLTFNGIYTESFLPVQQSYTAYSETASPSW